MKKDVETLIRSLLTPILVLFVASSGFGETLGRVSHSGLSVEFKLNQDLALAFLLHFENDEVQDTYLNYDPLNEIGEDGIEAYDKLVELAESGPHSSLYESLKNAPFWTISPSNLSRYSALFQYLKSSEAYATILNKTRTSATENVIPNWKANIERSVRIMKNVTGLSIQDNFKVYILTPFLFQQFSYGFNRNLIAYGAPQLIDSHATIYIWHEILHKYVPNGDGERGHSIIELAADNTLKDCLISGDECLSTSITEFSSDYIEGDPSRKSTRAELYGDWLDFLGNAQKNIRSF